MNPQVGSPAPVQNPFLQFLERQKAQGAPQAPGQNQPSIPTATKQAANPVGATPGQPGQQASGLPGVQQPQMDQQDAALPGQNPGTTKGLLQASSALHSVITQLTDPEEIRIIRTILILIQNLITRDQQQQNTKTGQTQQQGQQQGEGGLPPTPQGPSPVPSGPPGGSPVGGPPGM